MEVDQPASASSQGDTTPGDRHNSSQPLLPETGRAHSGTNSDKEKSLSTESAQRPGGKVEDESLGMDVLEAARPSAPRRVFVHK